MADRKQKRNKTKKRKKLAPKGVPPVVSLEDFMTVDFEAPIAESKKVDCGAFGSHYLKAVKAAEEGKNERAQRVFGLLYSVTSIHFKPNDRAEPFGPMFQTEDRRSPIPDDFRGKQSEIFAEISLTVENPALRSRLTDIAWQNDRSLKNTAELAIQSYCECVNSVAVGSAELYLDCSSAHDHRAVDMLRRACQVATATGWKDPVGSELKGHIRSVRHVAFRDKNALGYINISTLDLEFGVSEVKAIATEAETLTNDRDPDTARRLWDISARAHVYSDQDDNANRCRVQAAECYVKMAAAADFKGSTAASMLTSAIEALRRIPGTKARREELEKMLREAQAVILEEMGQFSTEIDLTEIREQAQDRITGLTLTNAFAQFASLDSSPSPDALKEEVLKQAKANPLSAIIPMSIHDDEGKVVAKSPGLGVSGESDATAIQHLIARNEGIRRQITVSGMIEPTRSVIVWEHPLQARHFLPLMQLSPFVPPGRNGMFALGFARFFGGDFVSAVHLLVPQLENSMRFILKQADIDASRILNDMTQESRSLSVMLEKDCDFLNEIFGPEIVFEIENLFDFRGGPSIRHQLAHGLLSSGSCQGSDAIYACWFIFRLCCLPLFPHWQAVTDAYSNI